MSFKSKDHLAVLVNTLGSVYELELGGIIVEETRSTKTSKSSAQLPDVRTINQAIPQ